MEIEQRKEFMRSIAAYLLNKNKTLSISGPKEKVERLARDLTHLKDLIVRTVPEEEKIEGTPTKREYVIAGIVGYFMGKDTGVKFKGDKHTTNEMAKAINAVKNDIVVRQYKPEE
jgi:malonyl CoA-acyl carrier protein transacylase